MWPQAVDALVTAASALTGYQASGSAGSGVPVFDSFQVVTSQEFPAEFLLIGWGDDLPIPDTFEPGNLASPGTANQSWHAMSLRREDGEVYCWAVAHGGSVDPSDTRTRATAVLDDFLSIFADDKTLGGLGWDFEVTDLQPSMGLDGERGDYFGWRITVSYGAQMAQA